MVCMRSQFTMSSIVTFADMDWTQERTSGGVPVSSCDANTGMSAPGRKIEPK